jgi:hypothetical protein
MRFTNQQLTLWYGTEDAPAPNDGSIQDRRGVSVTVAVQPAHPSNVVTVHFRVDHGPLQVARGSRVRGDHGRGIEYHRVALPDFSSGAQVSYVPVVSCAGRSAPDPATAAALPSSFHLSDAPAPKKIDVPPARERTPPAFEYVASIHVPLQEPEVIGVTPDGLLVNWFWSPNEGWVDGLVGDAKVRKIGGDWMTIRTDGIGVMDVRATVETHDGALLYASYLGHCDFGEDGYRRFLDRRWPDSAPTRTAPRISTAHPNYSWLNRLQCIGIGAVRMKELIYDYDLYALR